MPAIVLYFLERKADAQTTVEALQTAVDVATMLVPGSQTTLALRMLNYADKGSSVASILANATAQDAPEIAKVLGMTSLILGLADVSTNGVQKLMELKSQPQKAVSLIEHRASTVNSTNHTWSAEHLADRILQANVDADVAEVLNTTNPKAKEVLVHILTQEQKLAEGAGKTNIAKKLEKVVEKVQGAGDDLASFINKTLTQKVDEIATIWNTKYPVQEMLEGRSFFEDIMGQYRYLKSSGWEHTGDISEFFKGVDFYKGTTVGDQIFANTAVSMKTTITTNVDNWLASAPIKKNIEFLEQGWKNANGLESNGMKMFFNNAEIHIYMPKTNITDALKRSWMNKLNTVNPKIKFEIKTLEDFVQ